jgi:hypothetical protein
VYTVPTLSGWAVAVQDLHVDSRADGTGAVVTGSRTAYSAPHPASSRSATNPPPTCPPPSPSCPAPPRPPREDNNSPAAPVTLSYSHPYILAALPDNTLLLHTCASTASALALSEGVRLWGHTSGVGGATVAARGRAVSVSRRGGEVRVWELEGGGGSSSSGSGGGGRKGRRGGVVGGGSGAGREHGPAGAHGSVAIRPRSVGRRGTLAGGTTTATATRRVSSRRDGNGGDGVFSGVGAHHRASECGWGRGRDQEQDRDRDWGRDGDGDWDCEARRSCVGFDDERALVLKRGADGRESLVVYDFS